MREKKDLNGRTPFLIIAEREREIDSGGKKMFEEMFLLKKPAKRLLGGKAFYAEKSIV